MEFMEFLKGHGIGYILFYLLNLLDKSLCSLVCFQSVLHSKQWSVSCFKISWKSMGTSTINLDSPIWGIRFYNRVRNILNSNFLS